MIIFSYFADTVAWIADHFEKFWRRIDDWPFIGDGWWRSQEILRLMEGREGRPCSGSRQNPVRRLAGADEDKFDILVTTDVLAEGVNLQQARNIINYDLPWNPMRLVQRHGRIDRIGSPHRDVYRSLLFPGKAT